MGPPSVHRSQEALRSRAKIAQRLNNLEGKAVRFLFGPCAFDPESRILLRDGKPAALSPKAFQLLELLIEKRPRVVSKQEIHDRLWPQTFVLEANLPNLVAEIRAAIGDTARASRCVRTAHGTGYAFCGRVTEAPGGRPYATGGRVYRLVWGSRDIALVEGENLLGRDPDAPVWIDSTTVSRLHARIIISPAAATLEDLGSKNGTYLRGRKVTSKAPLADGDEVRFGSIQMTFRIFDSARSTETASTRS